MTMKHFFLMIAGITAVFFCLDLYSSETIKLKPQTPVFDRPMGRIVYVLNKEKEFVVEKEVLVKKEKFPFTRCISFYKIRLKPDADKAVYVAPVFKLKITDKIVNGRKQALIVKHNVINWTLTVSVIICLTVIFYFIYFHLIKKEFNIALSVLIFCVFLFFLRWVILASVQGYPISIFCCATDERLYFQGAKDIIDFNFTNLSKVSIGTPLYYVPFCLIFGQKDIYQVLMQISKFNGFILMPIITVMLFFIARKITGSYRKSIIYTLIFSILPLFYHNYECWQELLFKSRFSIPAAGGYRLYKQYLSLGFNNLPDMPSFFVLISLILYSVYGKKNYLYIIVISFLFSFACLIRLNNILMAPMVAFIFWFKFKDEYSNYKKILAHIAVALLTFIIVFSGQGVINYLNFGAIASTAYGSVGKISNTAYMSTAVKAMIGSNYLFMVLGLAGLIFQINRKYRIILTLWAVPMILFFATTDCISVAPYRYLIAVFPGLLLAFFSSSVWGKMNRLELSAVIVSLVFTFVFAAPGGMAPFSGVLPFDLQLFEEGRSIAVFLYCAALLIDLLALFFVRKNKNVFLFLLFTLGIFFIGNSLLIIAVFIFIILRNLTDIFYELMPLFRHFYIEISGKNISQKFSRKN